MLSCQQLIMLALPLLASAARVKTKRNYNNWNITQCAWAPTEICKNQELLFDPYTGNCYSPAAHPDPYNCAYLEFVFNDQTDTCDWSQAGYETDCNDKCMQFDPNTGTCYNPAIHFNDFTCALVGQFYDAAVGVCTTTNPRGPTPNGDNGGLSTNCNANGQMQIVDDNSNPTGQCGSCGWCQSYGNMGTPACTTSGQCTLICPSGQKAVNEYGVLYCR